MALSDYITECRRMLHDANGNFYTDAELTDYINQGRTRLVRDTGCLRTYQTSTVAANQEIVTTSSLPSGTSTLDILTFNLIWGSTRIALRYMPFTEFNAQLRYYQSYTGRPIAYSMYGQTNIYLGPVPDQTYTIELDTVVMPTALSTASPTETIPEPYTSPVPFYACHKAKYKEQAYGESEIFAQEYTKQVKAVLASVFTRRITTPYLQGG
jgi:hypothetical protein